MPIWLTSYGMVPECMDEQLLLKNRKAFLYDFYASSLKASSNSTVSKVSIWTEHPDVIQVDGQNVSIIRGLILGLHDGGENTLGPQDEAKIKKLVDDSSVIGRVTTWIYKKDVWLYDELSNVYEEFMQGKEVFLTSH